MVSLENIEIQIQDNSKEELVKETNEDNKKEDDKLHDAEDAEEEDKEEGECSGEEEGEGEGDDLDEEEIINGLKELYRAKQGKDATDFEVQQWIQAIRELPSQSFDNESSVEKSSANTNDSKIDSNSNTNV